MLEAEPQFGPVEQAINHIIAALHAVIDEAGGALGVDQEQGRRLTDSE